MNNGVHHTIFVYGTLRQGGSNTYRMSGATLLGRGRTPGRLYRVDWYPGAIFDPHARTNIEGELYEVSNEHLEHLDQYEGEEYLRVNILVTTERGKIFANAWQYRHPIEKMTPLISGDWLREIHE